MKILCFFGIHKYTYSDNPHKRSIIQFDPENNVGIHDWTDRICDRCGKHQEVELLDFFDHWYDVEEK